jgi:uncharacterized membrane protein (UPF0136 family)
MSAARSAPLPVESPAIPTTASPGRRAARILAVHGIFLMIMGLVGFAASGFAAKSRTAVISGSISGSLLLLCAWLTASQVSRLRAIGAHAGMTILLLLSGVFCWRTVASIQKTLAAGLPWYDHYTVWVIGLMAITTPIALALVIAQRPPKSQRV